MPHPDPQTCSEILSLQSSVDHLSQKLDLLSDLMHQHIEHSKIRDDKVSLLVEYWETGVGVAKFVKFLIPVVAGVTGLVIWVKSHILFH